MSLLTRTKNWWQGPLLALRIENTECARALFRQMASDDPVHAAAGRAAFLAVIEGPLVDEAIRKGLRFIKELS